MHTEHTQRSTVHGTLLHRGYRSQLVAIHHLRYDMSLSFIAVRFTVVVRFRPGHISEFVRRMPNGILAIIQSKRLVPQCDGLRQVCRERFSTSLTDRNPPKVEIAP